jgi:hypothetical protein
MNLSSVIDTRRKDNTVMDINFSDQGLVPSGGMFYEPKISKPIRGQRSLTIRFDQKE